MGDRRDELIDQFLDGELSPEEIAELDGYLEADADAAQAAADRFANHRLLQVIHREDDSAATTDKIVGAIRSETSTTVDRIVTASRLNSTSKSTRGKRAILATVLSVGAVVVGLASLINLGGNSEEIATAPDDRRTAVGLETSIISRSVATLLLDDDCRWAEDDGPSEGAPLTAGTMTLEQGLAIIRFGGGAEAILEGPTTLTLLGPGAAKLDSGRVVVRASEEAAGFRLWTPSSEVVDLGTEFSVSVESSGETTLNVLEGEVSVRPLEAVENPPEILPAGRAVAIASPRSPLRRVESSATSFSSIVERVQPASRWKQMDAYEGFYYEPGVYTLARSRRGKGWTGPWRQRTPAEGARTDQDTDDVFRIVSGQMNVTWPIPGGQEGMLELPPGKTFRIRQMARPIALSQDGLTYLSFMVRQPTYGRRVDRSLPREGVRLTFRSSADYFGETISFGVSHDRRAQIQHGNGIGSRSAGKSPSDQTTLWVAKIVRRADAGDDVSFRIFGEDDVLSFAEPAEWDVTSRDVDLSAQLDLVVLTSIGASTRVVDELRIGPTWRAVAPMKERYSTKETP